MPALPPLLGFDHNGWVSYLTYYLDLVPSADVREVAALRTMGHFRWEDIPQLCDDWLADGRDRGSVEVACIALDRPEGKALEAAFERALAEIGAPSLGYDEAIGVIAAGLARAIADGVAPLAEGAGDFISWLDEAVLPWPEPIHVDSEYWARGPLPDGLQARLFDVLEASHKIGDWGASPKREETLRSAYRRLAEWLEANGIESRFDPEP